MNCRIYFPEQLSCGAISCENGFLSGTVNNLIDLGYIYFLQVGIELADIFETPDTDVEIPGCMVVYLHVKIIYLVKGNPVTAFVSFRQKYAFGRQHFSFCHSIHDIKVPDIHNLV